jgi:Tfp pilus assembly protein PilF
MMVDAYYNLSVAQLQRNDAAGARERLREARALDRDDPMLERLERFAATYERREPDLLYRVFVKYLPIR